MIRLENYKSGHIEQGVGYKYFVPSLINDEWVWQDTTINNLLEKASLRLGELNSFSRLVPNIDLFIQLHVTKEAVLSSRIEGTQTHIVLMDTLLNLQDRAVIDCLSSNLSQIFSQNNNQLNYNQFLKYLSKFKN